MTEAEKGVILREIRPQWKTRRRMSARRLSDPFPDVGVDSAGQRRRIDVDQILGGQSLDDSLEGRAVLVGERAALDVERQDPVAFAEGVSPVIRKNSVRDGLVFLRRRLQTVVGSELRKLGHYLKREADAVEGEQAFGIRSLHQRELGAVLGHGLRFDVRPVSDEQLLRDRASLLGPGPRSSKQRQADESRYHLANRPFHGTPLSRPHSIPTTSSPARTPSFPASCARGCRLSSSSSFSAFARTGSTGD